MAVIRCPKGHFYDNIKYSHCPYCGEQLEEDKTVSFAQAFGEASGDSAFKTVALQEFEQEADDEDHTVSIYAQQKGLDFITGWLVCVEGPERGRDYRLHQGFNRIGRDYSLDVTIADESVPDKKVMCAVVYDDRTNHFFAVEQPDQIVYLDEKPIQGAVQIDQGSVLHIGNGRYEFIPFCREGKTW
jgi:hypothetical protein